jgi:hypothetical protein
MAAGLGFKDFVTGEVLTAADVDGYLMQGVWVFASAAARDSAVTSPQEGNFAYLKDTNVTTYYTGSAWANLDTTGMTNPMTTTGDTIYSSSGSTPARLGIGSTGNVLTVAGGVPTWAAPASGGGMTLINTGGTALTGASVTISSIPSTYNELVIYFLNTKPTNDGNGLAVRFNGDSNANRHGAITTFGGNAAFDATQAFIAADFTNSGTSTSLIRVVVPQYANTSTRKWIQGSGFVNYVSNTANMAMFMWMGIYNQTDAITSLEFRSQSDFLSGTVYVYGVK